MKKLTQPQIKALAHKVSKDVNYQNREFNQKIREKALIKFSKSSIYKKFLKLYNVDSEEQLSYHAQRALSELCTEVVEGIKPTVNSEIIARELIIATIEYDDLESLIESVKNKFTN